MKKLLFICPSAPPNSGSESIQAGKYFKYLTISDAEILLLTSAPQSKGWKKQDQSLLEYQSQYKLAYLKQPQLGIIGKIKRRLGINVSDNLERETGIKHVFQRIENDKFDFIYTRSNPVWSHLCGLKIKQQYSVKWVAHFGDPWVDNPYLKIKEEDVELEVKLFKNADYITFTSDKTVEFYKKKYPEYRHKIVLMPNVYDLELKKTTESLHSPTGKLKITYTGNIYGKRNLDVLVGALNQLIVSSPVMKNKFELLIAGNIETQLEQKMIQASRFELKILGWMDYAESLKLQNESDVLVVVDKPEEEEIDKVFLPAKILDYSLTGNTIISITNKGSAASCYLKEIGQRSFQHHQVTELSSYIYELIEQKEKIGLKKNYNLPSKYDAAYNAVRLKQLIENLLTDE